MIKSYVFLFKFVKKFGITSLVKNDDLLSFTLKLIDENWVESNKETFEYLKLLYDKSVEASKRRRELERDYMFPDVAKVPIQLSNTSVEVTPFLTTK